MKQNPATPWWPVSQQAVTSAGQSGTPRRVAHMTASPGTWHDDDPTTPVPIAHAKDGSAEAARPVLEPVARNHHATITYQELATRLQDETGYRTRMLFHYWIGDVLGRVARTCHSGGEPLLSSLCVDAGGSVGEGYGVPLGQTYGIELPDDLDEHAALERLRCYQHFGAELPPAEGNQR